MLIFEKSRPGRGCDLLPECDVEVTLPQEKDKREKKLHLPELSEIELSRHYTELAKKSHGVNDGFYPLGSCTMKYNPKINEDMAALPGFTEIHPLQPAHTVQGCLEVIKDFWQLQEIMTEKAVSCRHPTPIWNFPVGLQPMKKSL